MSGMCGWLEVPCERQNGEALLGAMSGVLARFDASPQKSLLLPSGAVAVSAQPAQASLCQIGSTLSAVWGQPRFEDPALACAATERGPAFALSQGYALRKTQVLENLRGHFAIALLDSAAGEAFLAIDRMGTRPLYYTTMGQALVFGSNLDAIRAFPGADGQIDGQALYDYVHFHVIPGPQTIYAGTKRLLPGNCVHWNASAGPQVAHYWQPTFIENEKRPFRELKDTFRALLRKSVAQWVDGDRAGAFLSGGTDSSTVAGMLGEVGGRPARTYSIGFDVPGYDEMNYARTAARHFKTRHAEYYVTPQDVADAIPRIAEVHDQPFGNSSAVPTYYCAKLAREDGVTTLLGGDGGDELFGGNTRYATQYLYSLYADLPAPVRKRVIEPLLSLLPSVGVAGKVQRYVAHASAPMPSRYDNYNLLERLGPANVFSPDFLTSVDRAAPSKQVAASYADTRARSLINRMLAFDHKYTLADNDLPKVGRSCELAGVAVAYPLLDDAMVDFSLRLHPRQKLRGTELRYFFKKALVDFLPEEIIRKSKHGFGLPFGTWFVEHAPLRDLALGSLSDLAKRGVIRPQMINELTSGHVRVHAEYFGTMVWILMMLEQWFRHRPQLTNWRHA